MKEPEAKTKQCPINTLILTIALSANQLAITEHNDGCCITSDCAWWVEDEAAKQETETMLAQPADGHCGLIK